MRNDIRKKLREKSLRDLRYLRRIAKGNPNNYLDIAKYYYSNYKKYGGRLSFQEAYAYKSYSY